MGEGGARPARPPLNPPLVLGKRLEYFESCNFSRENTNIDVFVFMFDIRMINMSSECEYD